MHGKQKTKRRILKILRIEAKFHKAKPERKSGRYQFLIGRIFAGLLVPEPKTSLKCSLGALVSGTKLRSLEKKSLSDPFFP